MKMKKSYVKKCNVPGGYNSVDAKKGKRIVKKAAKMAYSKNNQFTASPLPRTAAAGSKSNTT